MLDRGEIAGSEVNDASISVAVVRFEHTTLRHALVEVEGPADSWQAGARLGQQLQGPGLRAVFVLSDGLAVNGTPLLDGLTQNLPEGVAVSGGLAGDGSRFQHTWVLDGARPRQRRICAVGFYGERLRIGHGHDGGWADFGPERRITRSEGNVLYELDGKPALDLYKAYLGERAAGLPGTALLFPLSLRRENGPGEPVVRTILGIDEQRRSMTFAGDMPQGGVARLMRASNDRLIESAGHAVALATQGLGRRRRRWSSRSAASADAWCWASAPRRRSTRWSMARPATPHTSASTRMARSRRRWSAASANCTTRP